MQDGIFINYRRHDAQGWAGRLAATLQHHLRDVPLFFDLVSIDAGREFVVEISRALARTRALLALIGPHWAHDQRLFDPDDLVRLEIATALEQNILVIPILLGGTCMPNPAALPDVLRVLCERQALELRDQSWEADCRRLARQLSGGEGRRSVEIQPDIDVAGRIVLQGSTVRNIVGIEHQGAAALRERSSLSVASEARIENSSVGDIVGIRVTSPEKQAK